MRTGNTKKKIAIPQDRSALAAIVRRGGPHGDRRDRRGRRDREKEVCVDDPLDMSWMWEDPPWARS